MLRALFLSSCLAVSCLAFSPSVPAMQDVPTRETVVESVRHVGYTETIRGTNVKFDMVAIPSGTYWMGSPRQEVGRRDDEGPQHPVRIRPFWMGRMEVTWDEFDLAWVRDRKRPVPQTWDGKSADKIVTGPSEPYHDETHGHGRAGHPVLSVSHHFAMEYCRWLSGVTGKAYRLPTEAEWEWAARAGTRTRFFFGDFSGDLDEYAWTSPNARETTHPVGKKKANPWGLHDIYGNVAEWCLDHYRKDFYSSFALNKFAIGPVNMPTADRYPHVVRGGSWADNADACRSAARRGSEPRWNIREPRRPPSIWWLTDADFVGFRVVRAVEEQEELKGIRSKVTDKS